MSAADRRVVELLERWMTSVDLHARYLALDDAAYARVQPWPKHERPNRWVVELARSRLLELRHIVEERASSGDTAFAEALERMAFLANLLGSEHVDRFIPLAQPPSAPPDVPQRSKQQRTEPRPPPSSSRPATMPRPAVAPRAARAAQPTARRPPPALPEPVQVAEPGLEDGATATVIADAVRLISWGREWPQLAGLIARLANRPPEAEIWKVLRRHRATIEAQARRPRD